MADDPRKGKKSQTFCEKKIGENEADRRTKSLGAGISFRPQASPQGNTKQRKQPQESATNEQTNSQTKEHRSRRWGTEAQGTHYREGETGHNVLLDSKTRGTQRSQTVSTKLQKIAKLALDDPELIFTSIAHLIDIEFLKEAYRRTRKDKAPGVSGTTAEEYAKNLDENLNNLHERLRSGTYKAPPARRTWLDKEDGGKRAIGIPEFEDKIVQRAVSMLLSAIYEQDFCKFSHGYREGHSPHQALQELREACMNSGINWIVDADICGFFDNIEHEQLKEIIKLRVNDGAIIRLIGKWLNAGVVDGANLSYPEQGTPQGSVISPILSNIYLHHVLDEWYVEQMEPQLRGRSFIIRFADDFIIGCEYEEDARKIMQALNTRLAQFGLTIHPEKSTLIKFKRPYPGGSKPRGNGTFDFLGFTHFWAKTRQKTWVMKRKTSRKRLKRTCKRIWTWCRNNRHERVKTQYQTICQKLRGHYQYYATRCNYWALATVYKYVRRTWRYWLSKRTRKPITWEKFEEILKTFPLPKPRIIHNI